MRWRKWIAMPKAEITINGAMIWRPIRWNTMMTPPSPQQINGFPGRQARPDDLEVVSQILSSGETDDVTELAKSANRSGIAGAVARLRMPLAGVRCRIDRAGLPEAFPASQSARVMSAAMKRPPESAPTAFPSAERATLAAAIVKAAAADARKVALASRL